MDQTILNYLKYYSEEKIKRKISNMGCPHNFNDVFQNGCGNNIACEECWKQDENGFVHENEF